VEQGEENREVARIQPYEKKKKMRQVWPRRPLLGPTDAVTRVKNQELGEHAREGGEENREGSFVSGRKLLKQKGGGPACAGGKKKGNCSSEGG